MAGDGKHTTHRNFVILRMVYYWVHQISEDDVCLEILAMNHCFLPKEDVHP